MKAAVSVPDDLSNAGEALGRRLGSPRSRLYATALADLVAKHEGRTVTARLDVVYAAEERCLEPAVRRVQARSLPHDSW